jgi:ubiquinone/menaquinone biosynthesis C-methylase UbiE
MVKNSKNKRSTSWGNEAQWYANHLKGNDTYHAQVIIPNLMRLVSPKLGVHLLDIGCGEGLFARMCAEKGAQVCASDISPELIAYAQKQCNKGTYMVSPSEDLSWVKPMSQDIVTAILTLQNVERIEPVLHEVRRVLKKQGRFICVLNHPAFRIPKVSSWGFDEKEQKQYRRIDAYLSARKEVIDMHPGSRRIQSFTYSFHRSLQDYMKAFRGEGFAVVRIEEWISHKTSEPGPRARAENYARKEFPLFMLIEAQCT